MRYISLFSGIGGLESSSVPPIICCESDESCRAVLANRFQSTALTADVQTLSPPRADAVVGGWPCQDISVAGSQKGLKGSRSGLFFEMIRVARKAGAHTIVAENVPNLLRLEKGQLFESILQAFSQIDLPYVSWRTLNAREFGLPHERRRVFIVASKNDVVASALHRAIPSFCSEPHTSGQHLPKYQACNAFYWTAGLQSISYSKGFVPTLKVGSGLSIPSPPALHFDGCVRKVRADECLRLQGFEPKDFVGVADKDIYSMAGNAVASPVGKFVVDSLFEETSQKIMKTRWGKIAPNGWFDGECWEVDVPKPSLATTLHSFIDVQDRTLLSSRAASGLLNRLDQSGKPCPDSLRTILEELAS